MIKTVIFGLGQNYRVCKEELHNQYEVVALCDNSPANQGRTIDGYTVVSPRELLSKEFDKIIITPSSPHNSSIYKQLLAMGIPEEKFDIRQTASRLEAERISQLLSRDKQVTVKEMVEDNSLFIDYLNRTGNLASTRISVIINTLDRCGCLKRLLDALFLQDYDNFEIVVVNGPSSDGTAKLLENYNAAIKIEHCAEKNLSMSRNIGINAAGGDIVIFIDDDAVPLNRRWLSDYAELFEKDGELSCCGGPIYRKEGDLYSYYPVIDVYGKVYPFKNATSPRADGKEYFSVIQGGNFAVRKTDIVEIGGFDEYYEYYHDESDVAVRLQKASYKVVQLDICSVYHEGAPNRVRLSNITRNLYPNFKNTTYFGYKNSVHIADREFCERRIEAVTDDMIQNLCRNSAYKTDTSEFERQWKAGVAKGKQDGLHLERKLRSTFDGNTVFKKVSKKSYSRPFTVCLLCHCDIGLDCGITAYIRDMAKEMVKQNVSVHIIYKSFENLDYSKDGIDYHAVLPLDVFEGIMSASRARNMLELSFSIYKKVEILNEMYGFDIIESPIWDAAGLYCACMSKIPVVTRLQTVSKTVECLNEIEVTPEIELEWEIEKILLYKSKIVLQLSDFIAESTQKNYSIDIRDRLVKNYPGIGSVAHIERHRVDKYIQILFVGRLERRKGIHTLFDAMEKVIEKDSNVHFRIVGDYSIIDPILEKTFRAYFEEKYSHLSEFVTFLGLVSAEVREQEMADCDIFCAPSLSESFGIMNVEAMRRGKPVVSTLGGGIPEVVEQSATGLLSEVEDAKSLAENLLVLIKNKELREEYGRKGYRRFLNKFEVSTTTKELIGIYMRLVNENHP